MSGSLLMPHLGHGFPAEQATTPCDFSSSVSWAILKQAPRTLNDPVTCKFSGFRKIWDSGLILGALIKSVRLMTVFKAYDA